MNTRYDKFDGEKGQEIRQSLDQMDDLIEQFKQDEKRICDK